MPVREANLDRLIRMRNMGAAGEAISPQDAQYLAAWIDSAVANNVGLDAGAGFADGWQAAAARRIARVAEWAEGKRYRSAARELRAELGNYVASGKFDQDLTSVRKPAVGRRSELYVLALRFWRGSALVGEETIRKDIAAEVEAAKSLRSLNIGG